MPALAGTRELRAAVVLEVNMGMLLEEGTEGKGKGKVPDTPLSSREDTITTAGSRAVPMGEHKAGMQELLEAMEAMEANSLTVTTISPHRKDSIAILANRTEGRVG